MSRIDTKTTAPCAHVLHAVELLRIADGYVLRGDFEMSFFFLELAEKAQATGHRTVRL